MSPGLQYTSTFSASSSPGTPEGQASALMSKPKIISHSTRFNRTSCCISIACLLPFTAWHQSLDFNTSQGFCPSAWWCSAPALQRSFICQYQAYPRPMPIPMFAPVACSPRALYSWCQPLQSKIEALLDTANHHLTAPTKKRTHIHYT